MKVINPDCAPGMCTNRLAKENSHGYLCQQNHELFPQVCYDCHMSTAALAKYGLVLSGDNHGELSVRVRDDKDPRIVVAD